MGKKQSDIRKIILRYKDAISKDIRVSSIVLFGSYANGTAKKDSDIDIAVVSPDFSKSNPIKDLQYLFRTAKKVDLNLEPLAFRPEEIKNPDPRSFESEIIETGKIIYRG